jgi:hypothetical protein
MFPCIIPFLLIVLRHIKKGGINLSNYFIINYLQILFKLNLLDKK